MIGYFMISFLDHGSFSRFKVMEAVLSRFFTFLLRTTVGPLGKVHSKLRRYVGTLFAMVVEKGWI